MICQDKFTDFFKTGTVTVPIYFLKSQE